MKNYQDEFTINDDFKEFIKEYVERTSDAGNEEILSIALRNCYTKIIETPMCTTLPLNDLIDAFPELVAELEDQIKSPRPPSNNHFIVGPGVCDLASIANLLLHLKFLINQLIVQQAACCSQIFSDFQQTWTMLAQISTSTATVDLSSVFTALNACCTNINSEFQQTWTILANLTVTASADLSAVFTALNACCTNINSEFQQTWTILANLTVTASVDLSAVFTALNACCTNINSEFQQTWTILAAGFDGTFSDINACCTNINSEFQQTWSILANLHTTATVDLSGVFTALNACCNNINSEFQQTWTILAAGFNGTFSSIAALANDFEATWTILAAGFNGTWTILNADFDATWTILAAGFDGTFSVLNVLIQNVCNPTMITQASFGAGGGTQYVISTPGVYKFGSNITFTPASATSAILITTSGVTLDMQCFSISQGNALAGVNAIVVNTGLTDVYIRNGTVENFTNVGISFQGNDARVGINNTTLLSCATRAIQFLPTGTSQNIIIQNCNIYNCSQGSSADNPLSLQSCKECIVQNCEFTGNGNSPNTITVINMSSCIECIISNIAMYENLGAAFNGITLDSTSSLNNFTNCTIVNNQSITTDVNVINVNGNANILIDCVTNDNIAAGNTAGFILAGSIIRVLDVLLQLTHPYGTFGSCTGFSIDPGNFNILLDCVADSNFGGGNPVASILGEDGDPSTACFVLSFSSLVDHFTANNNFATGSGSTTGIWLFEGAMNIVKDCLCANNFVPFSTAQAGITNDTSEYLFYRNVAYNSTFPIVGVAAGSVTTPLAPASQNIASVTAPWTNLALQT